MSMKENCKGDWETFDIILKIVRLSEFYMKEIILTNIIATIELWNSTASFPVPFKQKFS